MLRRSIRTGRRTLLRVTVIVAAMVTVLFGLSTIFAFGAATHKSRHLGWNASSSNADLVQVFCGHGQFHLTINFLRFAGSPPPAEPRGWHAGALFYPGLELNLLISDRVTSRYGAEVYWDGNGPQLYAGVFGLYPTLPLWGLADRAAKGAWAWLLSDVRV